MCDLGFPPAQITLVWLSWFALVQYIPHLSTDRDVLPKLSDYLCSCIYIFKDENVNMFHLSAT